MKTTASKGAKRKADVAFSKLVRARGACENCGETNPAQLQCAHIISMSLRRLTDDGRLVDVEPLPRARYETSTDLVPTADVGTERPPR